MSIQVIFNHIFGAPRKPKGAERGAFANSSFMDEVRRRASLKISDLTLEERMEEASRQQDPMFVFQQNFAMGGRVADEDLLSVGDTEGERGRKLAVFETIRRLNP